MILDIADEALQMGQSADFLKGIVVVAAREDIDAATERTLGGTDSARDAAFNPAALAVQGKNDFVEVLIQKLHRRCDCALPVIDGNNPVFWINLKLKG